MRARVRVRVRVRESGSGGEGESESKGLLSKSGVSPGAVVTLKVDGRTYYNPEGLVAIVYQVNPRTGGI